MGVAVLDTAVPLPRPPWRERARQGILVLAVFTGSWFLALAGVFLTQYYMEKGPSFVPLTAIEDGFMRWDGLIYRDIAETGYRYDGDPCHEQNVVFMPVFPLLTRVLSSLTGLGTQAAGLYVVRLSFLAALWFLFIWIESRHGATAALFVIAGLAFSAGSFAFHAFYSESTMLLCLALALYFHDRGHDLPLALASGVLSATRVTVAPFAILVALLFAWRAVDALRSGTPGSQRAIAALRLLVYAVISVAGLGLYLGYIAREFGNPFELIPAIKYCAWEKAHPKMSLVELLTLSPLFGHIGAAIERPYFFVLDVKTTNLIWTLLAMASVAYHVIRRRFDLLTIGFAGYVLLTFYANGKGEWLESSFRYYTPVFTIYLMVYDLWSALRLRFGDLVGLGSILALFAIDVMYMVIYMALFVAGRWHYF